jgi:hypothetical protein
VGALAGMVTVVTRTDSLLAELAYAAVGLIVFYVRPGLFQ